MTLVNRSGGRVQNMTSERQKKANQVNARRSTGPKTSDGKSAVRLNGLRHGLLAWSVVLPDEDQDEFEAFRTAMYSDLVPSGPLEEFLVDRVVNTMWRLRRAGKAETALLHWRVSGLRSARLENEMRCCESTVQVSGPEFPMLARYETTIKNQLAHAAAKKALAHACDERDGEETFLGRAIDIDAANADAFTRLSRYETTLERNFYRALHELQRLQAARQGQSVEVPHALDVDVSVSAREG